MIRMKGLVFVILFMVVVSVRGRPQPELQDTRIHVIQHDDWYQVGEDELQAQLSKKTTEGIAKNVIVFIGDGMGVSTVTTTRVYLEQSGQTDPRLAFEKFPNMALAKTYDTMNTVPDSAATATAILAGIKTDTGVIGAKQHTVRGNCASMAGKTVKSILDLSIEKGKSAGVVSTARITHATPAAAYAHSPDRNWESDADITDDNGGCTDIAYQLVYNNSDIQVILGGGRRSFFPNYANDTEYPNLFGKRTDNRDLVQTWKDDKDRRQLQYSYVWNREAFNRVDATKTDYLLGLFEPSHMQYELDRNTTMEPSLTEMVEKAINILKRNNNGYFLEVESGRIDHAHHDNNAKRAITDTIEFSHAVAKAVQLVDLTDTLIVVTADHSHVFNLGGYAARNVTVLGLADTLALDGLPYTALSYGNGPGYAINSTTGMRENVTNVDTTHKDYKQQSPVPLEYESHAGEEVGIYAAGPMSHLFRGTHEQNYIAHVMTYASCVGDAKRAHCSVSAAVTTSTIPITMAFFFLFSRLVL